VATAVLVQRWLLDLGFEVRVLRGPTSGDVNSVEVDGPGERRRICSGHQTVQVMVGSPRGDENPMTKLNLAEKFARFDEPWSPKIVGELNGQHVKLFKLRGEFVWHTHDHEDELFLVVHGRFRMEYWDRHVWVEEGQFLIVPRGVEHRSVAEEEVHVLLFEPTGTLNTGDARDERTVVDPQRI
jgi:mannose-6-phosphate isomerase-like protein (cupin superfamily)